MHWKETNEKVTFEKDKVFVTKNVITVFEGKRENRFYVVKPGSKADNLLRVSKKDKVEDWHKKLEYICTKRQKKKIWQGNCNRFVFK